jgi:hypothetical protein
MDLNLQINQILKDEIEKKHELKKRKKRKKNDFLPFAMPRARYFCLILKKMKMVTYWTLLFFNIEQSI